MIPEITWSAESAIDYFHHEERGKPTIFWKSEQLEIEGNSICNAKVFSCDASREPNLAHFPQFRDNNSLHPPISPHTKLYLLGVPHQWMVNDRFIELCKS